MPPVEGTLSPPPHFVGLPPLRGDPTVTPMGVTVGAELRSAPTRVTPLESRECSPLRGEGAERSSATKGLHLIWRPLVVDTFGVDRPHNLWGRTPPKGGCACGHSKCPQGGA